MIRSYKNKRPEIAESVFLAENAVVEEGATVGARPEDTEDKNDWGVAVVAAGITVGAGAAVPAKAMQESDVPAKEVSGNA